MKTKDDLNKAWYKFLENFVGEEANVYEDIVFTDGYRYEIINFIGTGINFNNSYGFLTVDFRKNKCRWSVQDFISATHITHVSHMHNGITLRGTNWSPEDYPCRIYGADNNGRLRFYTSEVITDFGELLDSYITVFQSVVFTIIKLKISTAKE